MHDTVTNRYAESLFALAKSRGALAEVARDVEEIGQAMASSTVASFVVDARITQETRREKLSSFLGGLGELSGNFVNLLFDKRREEVLEGLAEAFRRRMLEEDGAAEGVVESARPLEADQIQILASAVGAKLSRSLTLKNQVRPELIGGVRVLVGSRMLDTSVQGRLDGIRNRMLQAALPSPADA